MGIIDNFRALADLAQKLGSMEAYQHVLASQQEAIQLMEKVATLTEENCVLKEQVRERDERDRLRLDLVFRDGAYWRRDQPASEPYCARCFDADAKAIHLTQLFDGVLHCQNCDKSVVPPSRLRERAAAIRGDDYPNHEW